MAPKAKPVVAGLLGYDPGPGLYSRMTSAVEQMPNVIRTKELLGLLRKYPEGVPGWEIKAVAPELEGVDSISRQSLLDLIQQYSPAYTHRELVLGGRPQRGLEPVVNQQGGMSLVEAIDRQPYPSPLGAGVSHGVPHYKDYGQGGDDYAEILLVQPNLTEEFGSHWNNGAPGIKQAVAHARFDTHGDALRINELQSDLGIHNRKQREMRLEGVPDARAETLPFPLEDAWSDILIKRLVLEAARQGHRAIEVASPRAIADKVGGNIDNYEHFYGKVVPGAIERLGRKMGGMTPGETNALPVRNADESPHYATHQQLRDQFKAATGDDQPGPNFWRLYSGMRYDSLPPSAQALTYDRFGGSHPVSQIDGGLPQEMYNYLHSLGLPPEKAQSITSQAMYLAPHNARAMHDFAQREQLDSLRGLTRQHVGEAGRRYVMSDEMRKRIIQGGIGLSVLAPMLGGGTANAQESPAGSGEGTAGPPSPEQEFWSRMDAIAKSRGEEMLNLQRQDIFRRLGNNNLQFAKDPARGEFFERINPLAGRDFSTSISPLEWQRWYEQPEQGYGGPEHKALIANMEQAMDIPAIPEGYVRQQLGEDFATAFPEHAGGDLTMRQYMAAMPAIMGINKKREFWAAMRNRDVDAVRKAGEEIRLLDRQQQIKGQPGGERYSDLVSDVFANLTGQVYPRGEQNKLAQDGATMLLDAIKSGTPGGEFEDAPEWTREQYEQLKQQYGDEADRMLPQGGEKNHKRLAVYELASAMQDGPHAPAGVSTYATAQNFLAGSFGTPGMGASQRFYDLTDYAPRGRASIANERWAKTGLLRDKPTDRPYAVRGEEFGATDPKGWEGMVANTHNASFPMGAAAAPLMGVTTNPGSYAQLAMEKGPIRAAQFLGQTAGNLERLAPIRDGKQSREDFNQQRQWWQDWGQAKRGWISSRLGPAMQEVHGHKRQFLPVWADAVANTLPDIAGSPYELGATVAAAGLGGVRRLAANTMAEIGEEAAENLTYGPILGASQTGSLKESADQLIQIPKQNAYLLPRQDGTAVKADDKDYWEQLERSRQHHIRQLRDAYNRWDNSQPGRVRETGFGVVPQPNAG